MLKINIDDFVCNSVIKRSESFFERDIKINEDLLYQKINNKSILVIGGAGTIGSSFIKAVLEFRPGRLVVVDSNENGLTELTRDLRSTHGQFMPHEFSTFPMDYSSSFFYKMFDAYKPFDIVANFAAHKHVRSEKNLFSIETMLYNNVFHAKDFLEILSKNKPEHYFCVSTDKAANPVNVMGASKKLMENVILSYSSDLKITTARFANVAFSNGSLLDGFAHRITKNQPISCPSDVKRFFVSAKESGQICMLACILGESGDIYFPKFNSDKLVDFKTITLEFFKTLGREIVICDSEEEARLKAQALNNTSSYPVYFFKSDTSGEKLYEEFYTGDDLLDLKRHEGLGVIKNSRPLGLDQTELCLAEIKNILARDTCTKLDIVEVLHKFIPEFEHIETGKSLDFKM